MNPISLKIILLFLSISFMSSILCLWCCYAEKHHKNYYSISYGIYTIFIVLSSVEIINYLEKIENIPIICVYLIILFVPLIGIKLKYKSHK